MRNWTMGGRAAVVSLTLGLTGLAAGQALAQEPSAAARPATISVSAEGEASAAPDMAVLSLSVMRQAESAKVALDDNNKAMATVLDALKAAGIEPRDLQTSGFYVQPQFIYPQDGKATPDSLKPSGYQVLNSVTVRLRDLSKLGTVLDQAVSLGVNQGGNVQFANQHPDTAMEAARKDAVAKAMAKAKTLADAAGVKLGRVLTMTEEANQAPSQPVFRAAMMKEGAGDAVPVASGENSYSITVTMSFELAN